MARKTISILLILFQLTLWAPPARGEFEDIYHYYIENGIEAFYNESYEDAYFYFKTAHAIDPSRGQSLQYLNLLKRRQEGRLVEAVPAAKGNDLFTPVPGGLTITEKYKQELIEEIVKDTLRRVYEEEPSELTRDQVKDLVNEAGLQVLVASRSKVTSQTADAITKEALERVMKPLTEYWDSQNKIKEARLKAEEIKDKAREERQKQGEAQRLEAEARFKTEEEKRKASEAKLKAREAELAARAAAKEPLLPPTSVEEKASVAAEEISVMPPEPREVEVTARVPDIAPVPKKIAPVMPPAEPVTRVIPPSADKEAPRSVRPAPSDEPAMITQAAPSLMPVEKITPVIVEEKKPVALEKAAEAPAPVSIIEEEKEVRIEAKPVKTAVKEIKKKKGKVEKPVKTPKPAKPQAFKPKGAFLPQTERKDEVEQAMTILSPEGNIRYLVDGEEIRMDDALWIDHTSFIFQIPVGKSVVFVGRNIARHLMITEGLLEVTRIDKDRIRVKAVRRGNTIFYIWDDTGRWTFNIRCEFGMGTSGSFRRDLYEEQVKPFRFGYSNSWTSYYRGPDLGDMTQQSLAFTNWYGISGETPYGFFDASANTYKYANSTEVVGKRIGLNDGRIGPFRDFRIRGYDTYISLSPFTVAGRYFRGVLIDSYAFQHKLAYTYFRGQDKSVTIFTGEGATQERESYVEGFRVTLNPDEQTGQYTFNYVRGFGPARTVGLNSEAYSIETKQKIGEWGILGEVGFDQDVFAAFVNSRLQRRDLELSINLRDIDKDYQTVYGRAASAGIVGGQVNANWKPKDFSLSTHLDVYRDRDLPNLENPDLLNVDLSTSFSRPIDDTSNWGVTFAYANTPQVISPRQSVQLSANYGKDFKIGSRNLSFYLSEMMHWSRNDLVPTSDYDRFSVRAGIRTLLIKNLFYTLSYDYIVVRDVFNDEISHPMALQTGLNYNVGLTDSLSLGASLIYRNEEQAQNSFSFLAGEDSLYSTLNFTYQPVSDVQVFLDSQLRRVWPENTSVISAYYDWNLTMGLRANWDVPFRWNPTGKIRGIVYKDFNGNSLQDKDEPGMPGVKVVTGKFQTVTNENGEYELNIRAKKAAVSLDLRTVPQGFIFSTAVSRDVVLEHNKAVAVNFGLTSRSGIYGIAYVDVNESGKPDQGDKFLSNILLRLDSAEITKTNSSGAYFFEDISPGRHKLRIDLNSIPLKYSPTVKIEAEVELQEGMTYVYNIPVKENPAAE